MLRLATQVTSSPTRLRRNSSATSATATTSGPRATTRSRRATPRASPTPVSLSSHTSRVDSTSGVARPPDWRSRALRCRRIRSRSATRPWLIGWAATSRSSRYRRRSAGAPFTMVRSSGPNTVATRWPSRSRVRVTRLRLTCIRRRPDVASSTSRRVVRPACSTSALRMARSAPVRTRASVGTPRNEAPVANQATASTRLVLPWPLSPMTAVRPSPNDRSTDARFRKSVSASRRIGIGRPRRTTTRGRASAGRGSPRPRSRGSPPA